jgi:hypothetical protein
MVAGLLALLSISGTVWQAILADRELNEPDCGKRKLKLTSNQSLKSGEYPDGQCP